MSANESKRKNKAPHGFQVNKPDPGTIAGKTRDLSQSEENSSLLSLLPAFQRCINHCEVYCLDAFIVRNHWVFYFARATIRKYQRLSDLYNRVCFLTVLETRNPRLRLRQVSLSPKPLCLACRWLTSLCVLKGPFFCVHTSLVFLLRSKFLLLIKILVIL